MKNIKPDDLAVYSLITQDLWKYEAAIFLASKARNAVSRNSEE
jgi:hypothetical protein